MACLPASRMATPIVAISCPLLLSWGLAMVSSPSPLPFMPISGSNCDKQHYVFGRYTGISFPKMLSIFLDNAAKNITEGGTVCC